MIENNTDRLGKNLWTEKLEGEQIILYQAYNEQDEARFVADILKDWMNKGEMYEDAAVLYRSNAQSRALEEALLRSSICLLYTSPSPRDQRGSGMAGWG